MNIASLSEYVKSMRKEHGLTQVELSEKSGVGLRFVRELEQGKQTLRLDKVNQVLNLFGTKVGVFFQSERNSITAPFFVFVITLLFLVINIIFCIPTPQRYKSF